MIQDLLRALAAQAELIPGLIGAQEIARLPEPLDDVPRLPLLRHARPWQKMRLGCEVKLLNQNELRIYSFLADAFVCSETLK